MIHYSTHKPTYFSNWSSNGSHKLLIYFLVFIFDLFSSYFIWHYIHLYPPTKKHKHRRPKRVSNRAIYIEKRKKKTSICIYFTDCTHNLTPLRIVKRAKKYDDNERKSHIVFYGGNIWTVNKKKFINLCWYMKFQ